MRRGRPDEDGFTLIELIVTIAITSVVMGTLSMAIIVGLRTTDAATARLADSHDLQLLSIYLPADAQSAVDGRTDTNGATGVGCAAPNPPGTNVLHLVWDEPGGTQTFTAAYLIEGPVGSKVLARYSCVNTGTLRRVVVAHGLSNASADVTGRAITMHLTLTSGLTTSITAYRRTPGAVPPDLLVTFPVNGGEYNNAGWTAGCTTAGVCGTATDSVGVQKVEVAVLRVATGQYWNGTSFASASTVYNLASGTTTWSYAFAATNFPAEGSYAITARVTNNLGTQATASRTFVIDRSAPVTSDNTAALGSTWRNTDQTVTLSPTDSGGAGVTATYYTNGTTTPTTSSANGTSILLNAEGSFTVKYFSVDGAGNAEAVKTAATAIRIDKTAPTSATLTLPTSGYVRNGAVLNGSGTDALSGIASLDFLYCSGAACAPSTVIGTAGASPGSVTWNSQPADGTYRVMVRARDAAGNSLDSAIQSVTVDNTAPGVASALIQLTNGGNPNNAGKAEQDDTVTVGFSEALKASSMCSTWTSDSTTQTVNGDNQVTATITDKAGGNDELTVTVSGVCGDTFTLGTIALGGNYVTTNTTFSGKGAKATVLTWNPTAKTLIIELGTQNGNPNTVNSGIAAATVTYTPTSGLTDIAGNPLPTTAVNSSGTSRL